MDQRRRGFSCLPLLLVAVAGCSIDGDDVRRQAKAWTDLELKDYVFVWFQGCFCDIPDLGGIRVVVRDGVAGSAVGVQTGLPLIEEAITMDEVFDRVANVADEDPDEFHVQYDKDDHFIRSASADQDTGAQDDGFSLQVRCFSRDLDAGCPIKTLTEDECKQASGTPTDANQETPSETCASFLGGAIGQIAGSAQVCCAKTF